MDGLRNVVICNKGTVSRKSFLRYVGGGTTGAFAASVVARLG
jgi:hypothetical protein